jgi:DNA-binding CsgD family transcriptional regulator
MPFAGVHRIVLTIDVPAGTLPHRQREALDVAFGMIDGPAPDRFLVGLAVLGLLRATAHSGPLLICVDDAHWLDRESLDVLAFVARRLRDEGVVLVFATRPAEPVDRLLTGIAELPLGGLDHEAAVVLLRSVHPDGVRLRAAAGIVRATGGIPLALIDLAQEFSGAEFAGGPMLPDPMPIGRHLEEHYLRRVSAEPDDVQRWLLVAAAEPAARVSRLEAASRLIGVPGGALERAETAGLVIVRETVVFRHPLVRSAVYGAATGDERRRVHAALAAVTTEADDADLRAWHRAAATLEPDSDVADELAAAADRAGRRGGYAARATLLARAAELTPPGAGRSDRLLTAAEGAIVAGAAEAAGGLLGELDPATLGDVARGRYVAASVQVQGSFSVNARRASAEMLVAAEAFHGCDLERERQAVFRALEYALNSEFLLEDTSIERIGIQALRAAGAGDDFPAVMLRAIAALILHPFPQAVGPLRSALRVMDDDDADVADLLRFGYLGVMIATALWDERARDRVLRRAASAARAAGSLLALDAILWVLSVCETERGELASAGDYLDRVREVRRAVGFSDEFVMNAHYLGLVGGDGQREVVAAIADEMLEAGFGGAHTMALVGLGLLDLAEGRYASAYSLLAPSVARRFLQVSPRQLPDLIEAATRSGHSAEAETALAELAVIAEATDGPWARGAWARSAALCAADEGAEVLHREAIDACSRSSGRLDLARAHLNYGEWLRRMRRRREAGRELAAAAEQFAAMGAAPFQARAERELAAARRREPAEPPTAFDLTSQEAEIARLVTDGATNSEVAQALFISVNTVDYHLRKVFRKTGVSSRRELSRRMRERAVE